MIQFPAKERRGVGGRRLATNIIDRRDSVEDAKEAGYKSYNKQGSAQCQRATAAMVAATKEGDVPPTEKSRGDVPTRFPLLPPEEWRRLPPTPMNAARLPSVNGRWSLGPEADWGGGGRRSKVGPNPSNASHWPPRGLSARPK